MLLTFEHIRFHRNGVMGTSFYHAIFTCEDDDFIERLHAVQFLDGDDGTDVRLTAVTNPMLPNMRYRGDIFASAIAEACAEASANRSAYEDQPPLPLLLPDGSPWPHANN